MSVEAGSRVDEEDRGGAGGPTVPALPDNEFLTSRDFLVQPLNLQNYHEFEALKYEMFSTCSALGRYILRTSCILKPRIHGSFKTDRHHRESTFHHYEVKVESRSSRNTGTHLDENLEEVP